MELTGTVKMIGKTTKVSEKFTKRDMVIVDNSSQYPQTIAFQLSQDRCSLIDDLKVGDEVKAQFNLRGREWINPQGEAKYFNTLEIWRIETVSKSQPTQINESTARGEAAKDDLPF